MKIVHAYVGDEVHFQNGALAEMGISEDSQRSLFVVGSINNNHAFILDYGHS